MIRFFLLSIFLPACSSLPSIDWSAKPQAKVLVVEPQWKRDLLVKENYRYRKIHRMTPFLIGEMILVGNGTDGLSAYHRQTHEFLWRTPVLNGTEAPAELFKDFLYVGGNDGNFYCISTRDGSIKWTYPTKSENFAQGFLDSSTGVIYFLGGNNILYALEAESGKQIWTYSRQDTSGFSIRGGSRPLVYRDNLFVGFSDGSYMAFNAKSGSPIWELNLNKNKKFRDIDATAVMDGENIYVAGYDDKLYSIQASKGEINWRLEGGSYTGVSLHEDRIYYPTSTGEVWSLRRNNGEKVWSYKLKEGIATKVQVYNGLVVFGESQGSLVFLDPQNGKKLGSFEPGKGILSAPALDEKNHLAYFVSGEANLYSVSAKFAPPPAFPFLR